MDGQQFDRLTQHLGQALDRRRFGVAIAALGLAGLPTAAAAAAKKKKKKKKKKKATGPAGPRCTDGIKNGSESDIDCGGPNCPPCDNAENCAFNVDCRSGRCQNDICRICTSDQECISDIQGNCFCDTVTGSCLSRHSVLVDECSDCPDNWTCVPGFDLILSCHPVCFSSDACGTKDACKSDTFPCGSGGSCFRPIGGGSSRCGSAISSASTCGCASDQQCASMFGQGAFCVNIAGSTGGCSCGGETSFCVRRK